MILGGGRFSKIMSPLKGLDFVYGCYVIVSEQFRFQKVAGFCGILFFWGAEPSDHQEVIKYDFLFVNFQDARYVLQGWKCRPQLIIKDHHCGV
jgi:hypothetical protein